MYSETSLRLKLVIAQERFLPLKLTNLLLKLKIVVNMAQTGIIMYYFKCPNSKKTWKPSNITNRFPKFATQYIFKF